MATYEKKWNRFHQQCVREGEKVKLVYLLWYRPPHHAEIAPTQTALNPPNPTFLQKLTAAKNGGVKDVLTTVKEKGPEGKVKANLANMLTKPTQFVQSK